MIVRLVYQNALPIAVLLRSDQATGQPLQAGQSLEMVFDLDPDADGQATLTLVCEPDRRSP